MPYKQAPKSMALKALIGNQKNLPEALKQKILESPAKQTETSAPTGDQYAKRKAAELRERKAKAKKAVANMLNAKSSKDLKKGSEADEKTLERMSSDKYKSPAKKYKKGC